MGEAAAMKRLEERVTTLENDAKDRRKELKEIGEDVKTLLAEFNKLSGGKRALIGLLAIIGTIAAIVAATVTIFRAISGH